MQYTRCYLLYGFKEQKKIKNMKELQDKIDSIIDWLTEPNGGNAVDESDIRDAKVELKELKEQLRLHNVSKSVAKQYAEFCVRCDREGLPLLELDDYIKQYCC